MSFVWQQYIDLSRELIDGRLNSASERARLRAAISRAYYGAFIPTRDAMEKKRGKRYLPHSVHRDLKADLQFSDSDVCNDIGVLLASMKRRREKADYEACWTQDDERTARQQLYDAQQVLELLSKL